MSESSMYPSNFIEALTLLYLQNQDLSGISPEALVKLFYEVHDEIRAANSSAAVSALKDRLNVNAL